MRIRLAQLLPVLIWNKHNDAHLNVFWYTFLITEFLANVLCFNIVAIKQASEQTRGRFLF